MKKKLMGALLAATLVMTQVASVFAAGSADVEVKPVTPGIVIEGYDEAALEKLDKEVADAIKDANAGNGLDKIAEMADPEVKEELKDKELVGDIFDLQNDGSVEKNADGKYEVTLSLPGAKDMNGLKLLHYSANGWEVLDVVVNADGTVTVLLNDFSPAGFIAVVADAGTGDGAGNGAASGNGAGAGANTGAVKSPQTGDWN